MNPHRWMRAAAFAYAFFGLAHTAAMFAPRSGPEEEAVVAAMVGWTFDAMGTPRTYWDFYQGQGFYLSLFTAVMALLCWMVGDLGRTAPRAALRLAAVLLAASALSVALCALYFFAAPLCTSALACAAITGALVGWRRALAAG